NYDHRFHGPVSAREALACSYNVPAVLVLQEVGVEQMVTLAHRLGLSSFGGGERFGLALTLGGGEVRLLELTAAYAAFANSGRRVEPYGVLEVRDAAGRLRYQARPTPGPQVLDPRVAYLITDILSDNEARAPAFGPRSILSLSRPAAAKTGTSSDWRDNWTVGYTPQLVTGVWAGNADGRPMVQVSGVEGAGPIWHDFMEAALRGQPILAFSEPLGLRRIRVCVPSGLLPTPYCPRTRMEWFIAGTTPTRHDDWYRPVRIDTVTGTPAGPETDPERVEERVYVFPPAEAQEWARENGWPLSPTADIGGSEATGSEQRATRDGLVIVSPDPGTVYRLSPAVPAAYQSIRVAARPATGVSLAEVTIYVDEEPLAALTTPPFETFWQLAPGEHVFLARGRDSDGRSLWSAPVSVRVLP
ncbi:MAG TPA: penicillin-binding protein, partial [Chloroflexi bacterium]|nr:penicillin-binding protein [Chloroflexota bacterium]